MANIPITDIFIMLSNYLITRITYLVTLGAKMITIIIEIKRKWKVYIVEIRFAIKTTNRGPQALGLWLCIGINVFVFYYSARC